MRLLPSTMSTSSPRALARVARPRRRRRPRLKCLLVSLLLSRRLQYLFLLVHPTEEQNFGGDAYSRLLTTCRETIDRHMTLAAQLAVFGVHFRGLCYFSLVLGRKVQRDLRYRLHLGERNDVSDGIRSTLPKRNPLGRRRSRVQGHDSCL